MESHDRTAVFVYPTTGIDLPGDSVFLPLSVMLPASTLQHEGIPSVIIDQRMDRQWRGHLAAELEREPIFVGISAMTGPQIRWGLRAAELVRSRSPHTPIVWGGVHPSVLAEETLADDRVDLVVKGRAVELIAGLTRALCVGGSDACGRIHRDSGETDGGRTLRQPPLEYRMVDWRRYVTPVVGRVKGLAHVTSRGCPHRCSYCYNQSINRSRWRGSSAEEVLDDLERLSELGVQGVMLLDDNFFADLERVRKIAHGLLARKLRLSIKADCRADYLLRVDDAFLHLLRRSGFEILYIGAESGSDRILEYIQKDVTVDQLLEANRRLARHGIRPHYSFMAGLPGETEKDLRSTVRLMRAIRREHPGAILSPIKGYVPYPGTRMYDRALQLGFSPPQSLEGWSGFDWNGARRPWLIPSMERMVEKATYLTAGLDTYLFDRSSVASHGLLAGLYRMYARLCRKRLDASDLGIMPELPFLRLVKRLFG
jgi:hypothetical protein